METNPTDTKLGNNTFEIVSSIKLTQCTRVRMFESKALQPTFEMFITLDLFACHCPRYCRIIFIAIFRDLSFSKGRR